MYSNEFSCTESFFEKKERNFHPSHLFQKVWKNKQHKPKERARNIIIKQSVLLEEERMTEDKDLPPQGQTQSECMTFMNSCALQNPTPTQKVKAMNT